MLAVVIGLGMTGLLRSGQRFVVYFDESVQGLDVEAPVKYRGVAIGRVESIRVAADSHLIEVVLNMNEDFKFSNKVFAQLKIVGITGNMYIELDRFPGDIPLKTVQLDFPTEFPVIPSRSSDIKQLFHSVDEIVQKIRSVDISGMAKQAKKALGHFDQAVVNADVAGVSAHLQASLAKIDKAVNGANMPEAVRNLNKLLVNLDKSLNDMDLGGLSRETRETLLGLQRESAKLVQTVSPLIDSATGTLNKVDGGMDNLNQQLIIINRDLAGMSHKLDAALDKINTQPSQLFLGDAPPRRRAK